MAKKWSIKKLRHSVLFVIGRGQEVQQERGREVIESLPRKCRCQVIGLYPIRQDLDPHPAFLQLCRSIDFCRPGFEEMYTTLFEVSVEKMS